MSETTNAAPAAAGPAAATAGALLRQARQAQGLHIAALAAAMKVPQRKLEALEGDRFDELPDATFTRALAQTVCRTLKIDAAPVLALLPRPTGHRLEQVGEGINAPFRDRGGSSPASDGVPIGSPALWGPLLILIAAAVVYFLPPGMLSLPRAVAPAPAASGVASAALPASAVLAAPQAVPASAPVEAAPAASVVVETVHSVPATVPAGSEPAAAAPLAGVLQLRTAGESWIEVLDGRGQTLLSRVVQPGEAVGLDGVTPLKVTIGNATATQVSFRGKALDLAPHTRRDNVARLDLK